MSDQKRDAYRIEYPFKVRPTAQYIDERFQVVDISEKGLKIFAPGFNNTGESQFEIHFQSGQKITVTGKYLRSHEGHVVFILKNAIPYAVITKEQIWLKQHYVNA